ncbi:MAG: hypothetical protein AAFY11_11990, partial [Cyanobacteria bacterium J06641_5]
SYFGQAVLLSLSFWIPLHRVIGAILILSGFVEKTDGLKVLLAITAKHFIAKIEQGHSCFQELVQRTDGLLRDSINTKGHETQEAFDAWVEEQKLNDPSVFLPTLRARLVEMVGDTWLYDPEILAERGNG